MILKIIPKILNTFMNNIKDINYYFLNFKIIK